MNSRKKSRDSTAGSALSTTTARFIQVLPGSAEALVSVVATPYMFTLTHGVNTHLNMLKKAQTKPKLGPEMKSKQPKSSI